MIKNTFVSYAVPMDKGLADLKKNVIKKCLCRLVVNEICDSKHKMLKNAPGASEM